MTIKQYTHKSTPTIYWIIIIATALGLMMPAIALLLTLRSMDGLQYELSTRLSDTTTTTIVELMEYVPRVYEEGVSKSGIPYFAVYVVYNAICLLLLLVFAKKTKSCIDKVLEFYKENNIVCFTVFFLVASFQSKMFFGFWFSGIAGWDLSKVTVNVLPIESQLDDKTGLVQQLMGGINTENLITYFDDGCVEGQVVLGFTEDDVVAINHGVVGVVFPEPFLEFEDKSLWLQMANHSIEHSAMGHDFLGGFRYPSHSTYLPLNLDGILAFKKIEVWDVTVCHEGEWCYISQAELVRSHAHN